jgi:hypothetical protein
LLFEKGKIKTFASAGKPKAAAEKPTPEYDDEEEDTTDYSDIFKDMPTPSWDYFYNASEEDVPKYRVEPAKSGRSACTNKAKANPCEFKEKGEEFIKKGDLRVGYMDKDSGAYIRWKHLACWRVPSLVWMGLPDPDKCDDPALFEKAIRRMEHVLVCGFSELNELEREEVVAHFMDKTQWAKFTKPREQKIEDGSSSSRFESLIVVVFFCSGLSQTFWLSANFCSVLHCISRH